MREMLQLLIDLIFPPKPEELRLRVLSPVDFIKIAQQSSSKEALFSYQDPLVKELVWQIKYKKNKQAIKIAGYAIYKILDEKFTEPILLIPIPISKKRRRERGYNQCELVVDEILRLDQENRFLTDYNLLARVKHIERQTLKGRKERIENTKNIFEVNKKSDNQKIILIDDVITTGSTVEEAKKALLLAGYNDVYAIAIAH